MSPLETSAVQPPRCLARTASPKVERGADRDNGDLKLVSESMDEIILPRSSQANPETLAPESVTRVQRSLSSSSARSLLGGHSMPRLPPLERLPGDAGPCRGQPQRYPHIGSVGGRGIVPPRLRLQPGVDHAPGHLCRGYVRPCHRRPVRQFMSPSRSDCRNCGSESTRDSVYALHK